jgi:hypothetical protein
MCELCEAGRKIAGQLPYEPADIRLHVLCSALAEVLLEYLPDNTEAAFQHCGETVTRMIHSRIRDITRVRSPG